MVIQKVNINEMLLDFDKRTSWFQFWEHENQAGN